jgi:hypothetical protein
MNLEHFIISRDSSIKDALRKGLNITKYPYEDCLFAASSFNWINIAKRYDKIYREIIYNEPPSAG